MANNSVWGLRYQRFCNKSSVKTQHHLFGKIEILLTNSIAGGVNPWIWRRMHASQSTNTYLYIYYVTDWVPHPSIHLDVSLSIITNEVKQKRTSKVYFLRKARKNIKYLGTFLLKRMISARTSVTGATFLWPPRALSAPHSPTAKCWGQCCLERQCSPLWILQSFWRQHWSWDGLNTSQRLHLSSQSLHLSSQRLHLPSQRLNLPSPAPAPARAIPDMTASSSRWILTGEQIPVMDDSFLVKMNPYWRTDSSCGLQLPRQYKSLHMCILCVLYLYDKCHFSCLYDDFNTWIVLVTIWWQLT